MTEFMETAADTTMEAAATDTDPAGSQTTEETGEATLLTGDAVSSESEENHAATETQGAAGEPHELTFMPVYNGTVQPIKASDTARVTTLLQKGMKFERMADDLEKLHRLSADYGTKSVSDLLDVMISARDMSKKDAYVKQYGEEVGEKLFALEQAQSRAADDTFAKADSAEDQASRDALHARLANEFVELQAAYPMLTDFRALPPEVIDQSLQKGISLLDAYNRHTLKEQQRTAAAAARHAQNQQSSTGSLADGASYGSDPVWDAFMQGVRRRS